MAKFLLDSVLTDVQPKKFIELGSGTTLPSLVTAARGHMTVTTDLKKVLPLTKECAELNTHLYKEGSLFVEELEWGNESHMNGISSKYGAFDYIIASDLIYIPEVFVDLVETMKQICSLNKETKILMSYRIRLEEKVVGFMQEFDKYFDYEYISAEELQKIHPNTTERFLVAKIR